MSGDQPHDPTTPEGHTPEKPAPNEIGAPGTPAAAMTPDVPHAADADLVEHGESPADPHAGADGVAHHDGATATGAHTALSDDDHGHAEPPLGPIDWPAWGFAVLGVAAGLAVVALFYVATS